MSRVSRKAPAISRALFGLMPSVIAVIAPVMGCAGFQGAIEINPERLRGVLCGGRIARAVLTEGWRCEREQEEQV